MKRLSHHYVETKFIACILELYKLSNEHIQFRENGDIGNPLLVQFIEKCYTQFLRSGQHYDDWFDRQVIECRLSPNKSKAKIPITEIHRRPLFIAVFNRSLNKNQNMSNRNNVTTYFYPLADSSLYSDKPIPVKLDPIFQHFNLDCPQNLTALNCPTVVNLFVYENGKVINDCTCPGISDSAKLEIAFHKNNYYWLLGQVPKIFKCTKHPGICSRLFKRKRDRERHESICKVETDVISKQVLKKA